MAINKFGTMDLSISSSLLVEFVNGRQASRPQLLAAGQQFRFFSQVFPEWVKKMKRIGASRPVFQKESITPPDGLRRTALDKRVIGLEAPAQAVRGARRSVCNPALHFFLYCSIVLVLPGNLYLGPRLRCQRRLKQSR
jgi:hypothetical protein